jgi:branched-chain amino acid transport system permease protein
MDFNWTLFTQVMIIGISTGAVIALIALGYTLVYGIIELINFAHGEVFMIGAVFAATVVGWTGATTDSSGAVIIGVLLLAMILAMIFSASVNFGIDRVAYRRLRNSPRLAALIAAIGMSFILQGVGIYWWGSNPGRPPTIIPLEYRTYNILTEWFDLETRIRIRLGDLFVICVTIPLLILLSWFVYRTRVGAAMRATAQDRQAAALMGIDANLMIGMTFVLGGALAGAAGLIAAYYNDSIRYSMGFQYGLYAFTAAVLGGIGNLTGAVLGGFLIGITWALSDGFMREFVSGWGPHWTNSVIFGVLILVLIFRPSGLLGEHTADKV